MYDDTKQTAYVGSLVTRLILHGTMWVLSWNTNKNPNEITEDRQTRRRQNYNTSKEEVLNSDELATRNRNIGANASSGNSVTQTIVREQKKIGRNERVLIRNIQTGELKELKYKQAEPLINTGKWIINDN